VRSFEVFSRRGCHLCELLLEELAIVVRGRATVTVRDIDSDAGLREKYGTRIPVVELDGRVICEYHLDGAAVENALQPGPG
jgi:hypothetical protein